MIAIRQATTADELTAVRQLMRAFIAWHRDRHHREAHLIDRYFDAEAFERELATLPGEYAPPAGRLLIADCDDRVAGCVALRDLGDGACEMKRMFVFPEFHGRGVGKALGEAIVKEGTLAGYALMRLDTGSRQTEAQTLYRRLGFQVVPPYYELPDDLKSWLVFMEKELSAKGERVMNNTLHFSVQIKAPRARVWDTMLGASSYADWTSAFCEGSHYVGSWDQGDQIRFFDPDKNGMLGEIAENRRHEFVSIRMLGEINAGVEDTTSDKVRSWAPAYENYTFRDKDGGTELQISVDVAPEYEQMIQDAYPKALARLKELSETGQARRADTA